MEGMSCTREHGATLVSHTTLLTHRLAKGLKIPRVKCNDKKVLDFPGTATFAPQTFFSMRGPQTNLRQTLSPGAGAMLT